MFMFIFTDNLEQQGIGVLTSVVQNLSARLVQHIFTEFSVTK